MEGRVERDIWYLEHWNFHSYDLYNQFTNRKKREFKERKLPN